MTVKRLTASLEPNKKASLLLKNYVYLAPKRICKLLCILLSLPILNVRARF